MRCITTEERAVLANCTSDKWNVLTEREVEIMKDLKKTGNVTRTEYVDHVSWAPTTRGTIAIACFDATNPRVLA